MSYKTTLRSVHIFAYAKKTKLPNGSCPTEDLI